MHTHSEMNLTRVFDKLHVHYDAICLFCISKDSIHQLKFPIIGNETLAASQLLSWSKALRPVVSQLVSPDDHLAVYDFLLPASLQKALPTPDSSAEIAFRSQNNHWKKLVVHPLAFKDGKVDEILYLLTDQTLQLNQFEELRALSELDALTDLYNRVKLNHMIDMEYALLDTCGVLFFDVNNLKPVNDAQGHDAGDRLLKLVAESLRSVASRDVQVFRYGGDEFLIIAQNCQERYLDTLIRMCANRMNTLCQEMGITASVAVGKAWSDAQRDINIHNLIRAADKDMYKNKRSMKMQQP